MRPKPSGDALGDVVLLDAGAGREAALEFEAQGEGIGFFGDHFVMLAERGPGGIEEHEAEDESDGVGGDPGGEPRPEESADGGGDFEEHSDADVGEALADIGGSGSRRSGDDGDERGTDGVMDVDVKEDGENRNDDHTAAESAERAEKASSNGAEEEDEGELEGSHRSGCRLHVTDKPGAGSLEQGADEPISSFGC